MNDTNSLTIIGRLTRDAEAKCLDSGDCVINFSIAVNGSKKQGGQWVDEASFFDAVHFAKSDGIVQYLVKGQQVALVGSLRQERWTQDDGANRSKVVIRAHGVQLVGSKPGQQAHTAGDDPGAYADDPPVYEQVLRPRGQPAARPAQQPQQPRQQQPVRQQAPAQQPTDDLEYF